MCFGLIGKAMIPWGSGLLCYIYSLNSYKGHASRAASLHICSCILKMLLRGLIDSRNLCQHVLLPLRKFHAILVA